MSDAGSGFESQINCSNGIRHQVHAGGSVTSRDKDKELGWFMRVGAVAGSNDNGHGVVCEVVSIVQMKRRAGW